MTGEAYDHIMALVVLGVIFTASVFVVPSLSYVNLLYLDQQQLQNIALSAMKTILFDEGYPNNWGSMHGTNLFNESDVKRFGLADPKDPSLYVLDPNKVQRLANNPMGNISYQRVRDLLGLSGYGFSIIFRPLFKVDEYVAPPAYSVDKKTATVTFNVNVSRYDGQPVPNAIVSTYMVYVVDSSPPITGAAHFRTTTDSLGRCQGSQVVSANAKILDIVVFFKVTVGDRSTLVVQSRDTQTPNDIAKINVVGNNIILTNPPIKLNPPYPSRWVLNIQMYNFETSINLLNGSRSNEYKLVYGSGFGVWSQIFEGLDASEPSILIITFDAVDEGRTLILLVGPWGLWSAGGIVQLNSGPVSSGASACIQRDVIISGMAYIAELRLWKT
jgi:hypothetical protein